MLFLNKNKIDYFECLETTVKENKIDTIKRKIDQGWICTHNYNEDAIGRIWVLWKHI